MNAKVRNSNRRGSKNEMNMKVLNFMEINKRSGWQLAPLRHRTGQFMVVKSISNWHVHYYLD